MASVGDIEILQALQNYLGPEVRVRVINEVDGKGNPKSATEYLRSASTEEMTIAGVDLADPKAVVAYLIRDLAALPPKESRDDLKVQITKDEIAEIETTRAESLAAQVEQVISEVPAPIEAPAKE